MKPTSISWKVPRFFSWLTWNPNGNTASLSFLVTAVHRQVLQVSQQFEGGLYRFQGLRSSQDLYSEKWWNQYYANNNNNNSSSNNNNNNNNYSCWINWLRFAEEIVGIIMNEIGYTVRIDIYIFIYWDAGSPINKQSRHDYYVFRKR